MKKLIMLVTVVTLLVGCSFFDDTTSKKTDAILFKEEYESLNNTKNDYNDKYYRSLEIDEYNPMVYKNAGEIVEMINNEETFVVYFGFSSCPWCRSVISNLMDVADDLEIPNIYYVDVKEIRDTLSVDDEGNVITTKKGSDDYYKLLEKLDVVLDDYALSDKNGNEVNANEKRIYAPNIVSVVDGVAVDMTTGISDKQTDAYMELSEEMNKESYDMIKSTMEHVSSANTTCSDDKKC